MIKINQINTWTINKTFEETNSPIDKNPECENLFTEYSSKQYFRIIFIDSSDNSNRNIISWKKDNTKSRSVFLEAYILSNKLVSLPNAETTIMILL